MNSRKSLTLTELKAATVFDLTNKLPFIVEVDALPVKIENWINKHCEETAYIAHRYFYADDSVTVIGTRFLEVYFKNSNDAIEFTKEFNGKTIEAPFESK